jgi:hypothetical protein
MVLGKTMWTVAFWVVTRFCLLCGYQHFGRIYHLHLQGRSVVDYNEDGGDMLLQNTGSWLQDCIASQPRRPQYTILPLKNLRSVYWYQQKLSLRNRSHAKIFAAFASLETKLQIR